MPNVAAEVARPGPRPGFTRDEIAGCALRLMDREGASALTFRAVARELDVSVGTLSRYFPSLADLQDAVAAKVMSSLRPVDADAKRPLREQLARFGMDMMEVTRAHPYLSQIHGPESAAVISRLTAQSLKAMRRSGVELERATCIYSVVSNLAYSWGMRDANPRTPEMQARIVAAAATELGELLPEMTKLSPATSATFRRWFLLCIDGLLP